MAEAHAAMRIAGIGCRAVGRLQRENGSWSVVDEFGRVGPELAFGPYEEGQDRFVADVFDDADAALAAIDAYTVIDVDPLYTPALQKLLEVAERIARDRGFTTVDVMHVELALVRRTEQGPDKDTDRRSLRTH
ncbi:hypothetical protein AB0L62_13590 [Nocardia asteroides]|uniref:hypothetical protein n=1 Tax=Nocardia asteroides TaxID=1824 RepID=UPI00343A633C